MNDAKVGAVLDKLEKAQEMLDDATDLCLHSAAYVALSKAADDVAEAYQTVAEILIKESDNES
jgi:hypothetical protein